MATLVVHPRFNALYYGFYLEGFRRAFPAWRMVMRPLRNEFCSGYLKLVLPINGGFNVFICAEDAATVDSEWLRWADCYAKVNPPVVSEGMDGKLLPIGPSFGVRVWSWPAAALQAAATARFLPKHKHGLREHIAGFYRQARYRLPEMCYTPSGRTRDYIFFAGSLWKGEPDINLIRAEFVRTCRKLLGNRFEGGLAPKPAMPDYSDVMLDRFFDLSQYVQCIRRSALVFNTPGVCKCIGWKLPEFMALGKAIISLPIPHEMPAPLRHGFHCHFIDGTKEEMEAAIVRLMADADYRQELETNARRYYDDHLAPEAVARRIVSAASSPARERTKAAASYTKISCRGGVRVPSPVVNRQ